VAKPLPSDVDVAVLLAVDMVEFNGAGEWSTYVFDVLAARGVLSAHN
jgi:hypothetical protein